MNQILDYNPNKSSGGKSSNSDKIVRVFAVILILFAMCLFGRVAYTSYREKVQNEKKAAEESVKVSEPKINVVIEDGIAKVTVSHDKVIDKLVYQWDDDKEKPPIIGNGTSELSTEIDLPVGKHTLYIKVTDNDGNASAYEQTITSDVGEDIIAPQLSVNIEGKELKVTATDETEIAYVTYRWNDGETIRIEREGEDKTTMEFPIEILEGNNDLTIVAVDSSERTANYSNTFTGVNNPEGKITFSADQKTANIEITHKNGIESVTVKINDGEALPVNIDAVEDKTRIEFPLNLDDFGEGEKKILITATSVDKTTINIEGETKYSELEQDDQDEVLNENIKIEITQLEDNSGIAKVKAEYEAGIKEIQLNVNDVDYPVPLENVDAQIQEFDLNLAEGVNKITLTVIGTDDTKNTSVKELTH